MTDTFRCKKCGIDKPREQFLAPRGVGIRRRPPTVCKACQTIQVLEQRRAKRPPRETPAVLTCTQCSIAKPRAEFPANRGANLSSKVPTVCKACQRETHAAQQRAYRRDHPDATRAVKRRNYARHPEVAKAQVQRWQAANRERARLIVNAQQAIYRAVKRGTLVRPDACTQCGRVGPVEAAHADYSKQLEVTWLCRQCHRRWDYEQPKSKGTG